MKTPIVTSTVVLGLNKIKRAALNTLEIHLLKCDYSVQEAIMAITNDALDLTVHAPKTQAHSPTSDLRPPVPDTDICWQTLETCSKLFS